MRILPNTVWGLINLEELLSAIIGVWVSPGALKCFVHQAGLPFRAIKV